MHPTEHQLVELVLDPDGDEAGVAVHVANCAVCRLDVARVRSDVALLRSDAVAEEERTAECLDDERVAALVSAMLTPSERSPVVAHLAVCGHCRRRVAAVSRALMDPAVGHALATVDTGGRSRRLARRALLPIAAAAAAVLLVALPRFDFGNDQHRSPAVAVEPTPEPMSPAGIVADAEDLRWTSVSGADRYRVTLFDAAGTVLFEMQLADTVATLADSIVLASGRSYLWKVEARTGWDRWTASQLIEFTLGRGVTERQP